MGLFKIRVKEKKNMYDMRDNLSICEIKMFQERLNNKPMDEVRELINDFAEVHGLSSEEAVEVANCKLPIWKV